MRAWTVWLLLLGPLAVLAYDLAAYRLGGYEATITAVVRDWAARSVWPELVFLALAGVLYLHLFRGWPR